MKLSSRYFLVSGLAAVAAALMLWIGPFPWVPIAPLIIGALLLISIGSGMIGLQLRGGEKILQKERS